MPCNDGQPQPMSERLKAAAHAVCLSQPRALKEVASGFPNDRKRAPHLYTSSSSSSKKVRLRASSPLSACGVAATMELNTASTVASAPVQIGAKVDGNVEQDHQSRPLIKLGCSPHLGGKRLWDHHPATSASEHPLWEQQLLTNPTLLAPP